MAGVGASQSAAAPAGGDVLPRSETLLTPGDSGDNASRTESDQRKPDNFPKTKTRRAQEMQGLETPKPKASCPYSTVTGYKPCSKALPLLCGSLAPRVSFFIVCFTRHWNLRNDKPGSPMTGGFNGPFVVRSGVRY